MLILKENVSDKKKQSFFKITIRCHAESPASPRVSSRKASASRALLESAPASRRIPDCRFLTPLRKVRNDTGEELSSRGAPTSRVIPRSESDEGSAVRDTGGRIA
jgi:hypothetical protein